MTIINRKVHQVKTAKFNNKRQAKKKPEEQIVTEVQMLKDFDPDKELKGEFESASLYDLQKYLVTQDVSPKT